MPPQQTAKPGGEQLRVFAALEQNRFTPRTGGGSGYFLVLTDRSLGLGILIPTADIVEQGKPVHNYVVDIERNKVVGEIDGPDLHFFGENHGGISAKWHRQPGTGAVNCVITYEAKWGARSLRLVQLQTSLPQQKSGARYRIARQTDVQPPLIEALQTAIQKKYGKIPGTLNMSYDSLVFERQNSLLIKANGIDKPKPIPGVTYYSGNIVARYDLLKHALHIVEITGLKTGLYTE